MARSCCLRKYSRWLRSISSRAWEEIAEETPDLILLDLGLPDGDGTSLLARLTSRPETMSIPVIVVTAKDLDADDRLRLNSHVTTVLHKSAYESDALLGEIAALVRSVAATREGDPEGA